MAMVTGTPDTAQLEPGPGLMTEMINSGAGVVIMVTTAGPHLHTATLPHPSCVTRHWRHWTQDWDTDYNTILRGSEVGSVLL